MKKCFSRRGAFLFHHIIQNFEVRLSQKLSQRAEDVKARQKEMMARGLPKKKPIEGVENIILVSSAKGGVGKSTTAVNLAVGLKMISPDEGVGLLDADVFGPSIPLMMNLHESPFVNDKNYTIPPVNYGVQWFDLLKFEKHEGLEVTSHIIPFMSMGFLIEKDAPIIWRGLMVMKALEDLMRKVAWESIKYLVVDTPPGTGDTHLSLLQNLPIAGVVLVTTPQSAALEVTKRGATMYNKLSVPIIGIVENMSTVKCTSCSKEIHIFGQGTQVLASEINTKILQTFPLDNEISTSTDQGAPIVIFKPDSMISQSYINLAKAVQNFIK